MDYCDENLTLLITSSLSTDRSNLVHNYDESHLATLYNYFCPIIIVACLSSVLLNGILIKVRGSRYINGSPILTLSLNLAATDAIASFLTVLVIIFSSYLPVVQGIQLNKCILLTLEVARLTSLFASVLHLLALTWLHYQGTVNPIHHRLTSLYQRSENIKYVTLTCWLTPFIIFIFIFSSTSCQGYRSPNCEFTFLLAWHFRSTILILFGTPWLLMIVAYLHIFWTLEMAQKITCSRTCNNNNNANNNSLNNHSNSGNSNDNAIDNSTNNKQVNNGNTSYPITLNSIKPSYGCSNNVNVENNLTRRIDKSYRKAITTSLIIIITYLVGWMPAIIWFALSCIDGCPYPLYSQSYSTRAYLGFITTASVVIKPIVDPLIYSYRYREVRLALQEMFCPHCIQSSTTSNVTEVNNTLYSFTNRIQRSNEEEMITTS
ncbi:importin-13 homolog A-like [Tetranychus urticae]|uniref:G-protein coupled receptors family 1 profile domain-containing protein n=1 Tax=Tetranychus urticae TaxID=32264 RepID=T1KIX9_TETUR|nr:importin-13 homolog A-like [Tetranychus urticae]